MDLWEKFGMSEGLAEMWQELGISAGTAIIVYKRMIEIDE